MSVSNEELNDLKASCPTYYIAGADNDVRRMMGVYGFRRVDKVKDADIVVFTGGSDINPYLYGQRRHPTTGVNMLRDLADINVLKQTARYTQGLVGICRGGQLLNCLVGNGSMWQNVNHHAIEGTHDAVDRDGVVHKVNSYHHQMMIPGSEAQVLLKASVSTLREGPENIRMVKDIARVADPDWDDPEVLYYPDTSTLCFQPHPEERKAVSTRDLFFRYLEEYMLSTKMSAHLAEFRTKFALRQANN